MKNIFPIMKLTDRHTLVERRRDNGEIMEYIICNGIKQVENGEPNEYCWESGMYAFTLEGAIKTAALRCYEPIYRYVLIVFDNDAETKEEIFDDYDEAYQQMEYEYNGHCAENCYVFNSISKLRALIEFNNHSWIKWKLIEVKVD